jgi:hypothetical protein
MAFSTEAIIAVVGLMLALPSATMVIWKCYRQQQSRTEGVSCFLRPLPPTLTRGQTQHYRFMLKKVIVLRNSMYLLLVRCSLLWVIICVGFRAHVAMLYKVIRPHVVSERRC